MKYEEIVEQELAEIKETLRREKEKVRALSNAFDYKYYSYGSAVISKICDNFEEYLEVSADLPADNELYSYDLHWEYEQNDSVMIKHKVKYGEKNYQYLVYCFVVLEPARTVEKISDGNCSIQEKTTPARKERTYQALHCAANE